MFLGKNIRKARSISAALGLAAAVVWGSATTNFAQAATEDQTRGAANTLNDFQGNGRSSFITLGFTTGGPITWKLTGNPSSPAPNAAFIRRFDYGFSSDTVAVGDYIGDAKSDLVVFRDTETSTPGYFYVSEFPTGPGPISLNRAVQWGNGLTDIAGVQGDYDGDGKTDYTVIRQSGGVLTWYILSSTSNTTKAVTFGRTTGATGPAVFPGADFTGDGRDELIYITRSASTGAVNYFIGDSNTGAVIINRTYGDYDTDFSLAPDDYTGDGRADFVAVRETLGEQAVWYILNSATGALTSTTFGIADPAFTDLDVPVRGDFDGDNRHDICVWRSSNQTFYYINTGNSANPVQSQKAGDETDTPLGSFALY